MHILRELLDPRDLAAARSTPVLAVLWLTGGLLVVLGQLLAPPPPAGRAPGLLVGMLAMIIGGLLVTVRQRVFSLGAYAGLALLGAATISTAVGLAGPASAAATGVIFVYVCVFSVVALPRLAPALIAVAAAGHALVLWLIALPGWPATWALVWGVSGVTAVLISRVLAGLRAAIDERDRVVIQLEQLDETKTAFLHAVHHELSRPVTVLRGMTDTLATRGPQLDPAVHDELAHRAAAQANRLQGMLEDLLQLGGMGAGAVEVARRATRTREVIDEALTLSDIDPARMTVVDGNVEVLHVDPVRVAHALANLITNAAKYSGARAPITLTVTAEPDRVVLGVTDRGPGIPPDQREAIFEPFVRARAEDHGRGTGVGLAVVRAVARLHGGDAWAEDAEGGGARVSFWLSQEPATG